MRSSFLAQQPRKLLSHARQLADNILFPPHCLSCGVPHDTYGTICNNCFHQLHIISTPHCNRCGEPFAYPLPGVAQCHACELSPPHYDAGRSLWVYDDISASVIKRFKFNDNPHIAYHLAQLLYASHSAYIRQADIFIGVPLHPKRLQSRRYNQSHLLAKELARRAGSNTVLTALQRIRHTPSQTSLAVEERQRNVADAFAVSDKASVTGASILLVDDVTTTGATLNACALSLKKAGAHRVSVLTLAKRVIHD